MISPRPGFRMRSAYGHPRVSLHTPNYPLLERDQSLTHPDNYPEPGKRPLSSISPTILEYADGSLYLAIGGSGGSQIFSALLQTLLNLDWGMDPSQAVEYGRVHDQLYPERVSADNILPALIIDSLRDRGHNVTGTFDAHVDVPWLCADVLGVEMDINRVAAVIQTVVSKDGKIYGTRRLCVFPGFMDVLLTRVHSGERLEEKWDCRRILIIFVRTA